MQWLGLEGGRAVPGKCVLHRAGYPAAECVPGHGARPARRLWLLVNQMRDCSPLCAQGPRNPQPWLEAGEWQPGAQGRRWAEAGGWGQAGSRGCVRVHFQLWDRKRTCPWGSRGGAGQQRHCSGDVESAHRLSLPDPHGSRKGGAGSIFRM